MLGLHELPKDCRTLMQTPRYLEISSVAGGQFWYNGIAKNLRLIFSRLNHDITIQLMFNMDGLPIFKSSQRCFWPILASIYSKSNFTLKIEAILNQNVALIHRYRNATNSTHDRSYMVWI